MSVTLQERMGESAVRCSAAGLTQQAHAPSGLCSLDEAPVRRHHERVSRGGVAAGRGR